MIVNVTNTKKQSKNERGWMVQEEYLCKKKLLNQNEEIKEHSNGGRKVN